MYRLKFRLRVSLVTFVFDRKFRSQVRFAEVVQGVEGSAPPIDVFPSDLNVLCQVVFKTVGMPVEET